MKSLIVLLAVVCMSAFIHFTTLQQKNLYKLLALIFSYGVVTFFGILPLIRMVCRFHLIIENEIFGVDYIMKEPVFWVADLGFFLLTILLFLQKGKTRMVVFSLCSICSVGTGIYGMINNHNGSFIYIIVLYMLIPAFLNILYKISFKMKRQYVRYLFNKKTYMI